MDMEQIVRSMIENDLATAGEIQGCSQEEVAQLEQHFNIQFPRSYREFLLTMGHQCGTLFRGTDILYPRRFDFAESVKELTEESKADFRLPEDAFVFSMHQGYIFWYFRLGEGDDPPIYQYNENQPDSRRVAASLSEYLTESIETSVIIRNRIKRRREGKA